MTLPSTLIPPLLVLVFIGDSVICALAGVSVGSKMNSVELAWLAQHQGIAST